MNKAVVHICALCWLFILKYRVFKNIVCRARQKGLDLKKYVRLQAQPHV
jgi:hypothetical protein